VRVELEVSRKRGRDCDQFDVVVVVVVKKERYTYA
jgi:hypothetical protein